MTRAFRPGDGFGIADADEDARTPTLLGTDSDGDGIDDAIDVIATGGVDSDGNGIDDALEPTDTDGDGRPDHLDVDSDNDGIPDYRDLDSDNDGIPDVWESIGYFMDTDGDGYLDDLTDSNGDGLADNVVANSLRDTDEDGEYDHLDLDSDGDELFDVIEIGGIDLNGDGLVDAWADSDMDGIVDAVDVDLTAGTDEDGDGIDDFFDVDYVLATDTDGDGIIDELDEDFRGVGYLPNAFLQDLPALIVLDDQDGDGIPDLLDNFDSRPAAATEEPGAIRVGVEGRGGCSIGGETSAKDPLLPMLALLAVSGLGWRRRPGWVSQGK